MTLDPLPESLLLAEILPPLVGGSGRYIWGIYGRRPAGTCVVLTGEHPDGPAFDATHALPTVRMPLDMRTRGLMNFHDVKRYAGIVRTVRRMIRQHGVTQVHASRPLFEGFAAYLVKKFTGTPYVVYVHGEDIGAAKTSRELTFLVRKVFGSARFVIANSMNSRRLLLDDWQVPEARIRVVQPGVDAARFTPAPPDAEFRRELGWANRTVILTVSRLQKRKGQDTMIRALPAIRARFPDVLYALVGTGEEEALLRELARSVGLSEHVQFLGPADDDRMTRCYQQCDLFALPNRQVGADFEGFGMVLVEAQACGKPVIAGASGGTAETLRVPETGRLIDCTGHDLLAKTVIELLAKPDELRAMGRRTREWALGFDWPAVATKAEAVFTEMK